MSRGRSSSTLALLNAALLVSEGLVDYWPLTLRQIYYRLVAGLVIANNIGQYQRLSRVLSAARIAGDFPEDAMEDRSRRLLRADGYADRAEFVGAEVEGFLAGYRRDLLQSQPVALEAWVEKDALSRIVYDVAAPYCVPTVVVRGQVSTSFLLKARDRVAAAADQGKNTVILYFGDLDPSGWRIPLAAERTLREDLRAPVELVRCALNPAQVEKYGLPNDPHAQKEKDPNRPAFRKMYGDLSVELDALEPAILEELVVRAIRERLDLDALEQELVAQERDRSALAGMRLQVQEFIRSLEVQP